MPNTLFLHAGPLFFGLVVGWITYRTLKHNDAKAGLGDIAVVIGAVGGAAVTSLFDAESLFSAYCIGLAIGFFGYLAVSWWGAERATGRPARPPSWMGDDPPRDG